MQLRSLVEGKGWDITRRGHFVHDL